MCVCGAAALIADYAIDCPAPAAQPVAHEPHKHTTIWQLAMAARCAREGAGIVPTATENSPAAQELVRAGAWLLLREEEGVARALTALDAEMVYGGAEGADAEDVAAAATALSEVSVARMLAPLWREEDAEDYLKRAAVNAAERGGAVGEGVP